MSRSRVWSAVFMLLWGAMGACGQEEGREQQQELPALEEIHPLQEALAPLLVPVMLNNVQQLKLLIRGDEFKEIRVRHGDRHAVDVMFRWAEQLSWNNRGVALFIAFLSSIDHRNVGFRIPLLGPLLWLPLSGEFQEEFEERLRAMPVDLFPDSPRGQAGDRDKLQHFFGSAFLAYVFGGADAAERIGEFIEWGEDAFVVDGVYDLRDKEANARGRRFAARLREDYAALPSADMTMPLTPAASGDVSDSLEVKPVEPMTGENP